METLIETLRTAARDDADPNARRAGIVACSKILAMLLVDTDDEPTAPATPAGNPAAAPANTDDEPTAAPATPAGNPAAAPANPAPAAHTSAGPAGTPQAPGAPAAALPIDPAAITAVMSSLRNLSLEQLLDVAIARIRAALPPDTSIPASPTPLQFRIVPLTHLEHLK